VEFPTGFAALGLDFVKNVQTITGDIVGSLATAKPDSVRARVFNGYGAEADLDPELNHSSVIPAFGGVSPLVRRSIQAEELSGPSFYFATRSSTAPTAMTTVDWTFGIVDNTAPNCAAEFCVRAIGPRSDFTNPFSGGPIFIVWADDAGTGVNGELQWRVMTVAFPNFDDPFPTRDSGDNRIYEWTFDIPADVNPGELQGGLAIAAIGVRPTGDALLTALEIEPVFNVRFVDAPYEIVRGPEASVLMPIAHGMNSTGGEFSVQCQFLNDQGEPVNFPPSGLAITDNGEACVVTAASTAELGEYGVRATATQGEAQSVIETTVTVLAPEFEISLSDAVDFVPLEGERTVDLPVALGAGGPIAQAVCQITGVGLAATYDSDIGDHGSCVITIGSNAEAGEYAVTVIAQEEGTGAEATAEATLDLAAAILVEVGPREQTIARGETGEFIVTATFPNGGAVDDIICDSGESLPEAFSFAVIGGNGGNGGSGEEPGDGKPSPSPEEKEPEDDEVGEGEATLEGCIVAVPADFDREGGSFPFTITVIAGDQVVEVEVTVTVEELGDFAPEIEDAGTPENRVLVPQGDTRDLRIIGDVGFGIDLAASNAATSDVAGVTVTIEEIAAEDRFVVRLDVAAAAELGNRTVTVTLVEAETGGEVEVEAVIEMRVTDDVTGQGVIDG